MMNLDSIRKICDLLGLSKYEIDLNGEVSVKSHVNLNMFNRIIEHNGNIPLKFNEVEGSFVCMRSKLKTLDGFPKKVSGDFNVAFNIIENLDHIPNFIGGKVIISHNKIKSLIGIPSGTKELYCSFNEINSFSGIPNSIERLYINNCNITSFDGILDSMISHLDRDLQNGVQSNFEFDPNPIAQLFKLNPNSEFIYCLNEYDVIRGSVVISKRLERSLEESNADPRIINHVKLIIQSIDSEWKIIPNKDHSDFRNQLNHYSFI